MERYFLEVFPWSAQVKTPRIHSALSATCACSLTHAGTHMRGHLSEDIAINTDTGKAVAGRGSFNGYLHGIAAQIAMSVTEKFVIVSL